VLFKVNQVPRYQRQIGRQVETSTVEHKNNHKRLSHGKEDNKRDTIQMRNVKSRHRIWWKG